MPALVIFFDLDDTLLDSRRVRALLDGRLGDAAPRFWRCYEEVRAELGYADVAQALRRMDGAAAWELETLIAGLDVASCLHDGALDAVAHAASLGLAVIVTDGEERYQRSKARGAGLDAAVEGRVHVFAHKEEQLRALVERYPASHHALVDDRPTILAAAKVELGGALTTVHVRQGRRSEERADPPPDLVLGAVADFARLDEQTLVAAAAVR